MTQSTIFMLAAFATCCAGVARGNDLQRQIDAAIAAGQAELIIAPGEYRVAPPNPGRPHVLIRGAKDLTIVADGVTLVCTSLDQAVKIEDSQRLTIRGLTVDYDPLPFTQGVITTKADDDTWLDVKLDAGYPDAVEDTGRRAIIHDPGTRQVKAGTWTRHSVSVMPNGERSVRLSWPRPIKDTVAVGDLVTLTRKTLTPHAVFLERSSDCTLENVTLHASTSFGFFEAHGGGNAYLSCKVTPGPAPRGATAARLLSSQADAFHSKHTTKGPRVENCTFDSMGDDGIAINGDFALVVAVDGNTATISAKRGFPFSIGDRLHGIDAAGIPTEDAKIVALHAVTDGTANASAVQEKHFPDLRHSEHYWKESFRVELDKSLPLAEGHLVASPDRNGSNFVVRKNRIVNTRARGILVKASYGVIAANVVDHTALAGIVLCPETRYWMEADYSTDVVIRGNALLNVGSGAQNPGMVQAGAISICSEGPGPARGHRKISVENNVIANAVGVNLMITSASDVTVRDNRFVDPHRVPGGHGASFGLDPRSVVWITQSDGVTLQDNVVINRGTHGGGAAMLVTTATATNVKGIKDGITRAESPATAAQAQPRE